MGYKSRTDYIQEARVLYNMEIFPGGGLTLKEDILRVNARLIPSIYFLVVYTTTGKPQRSYDLHYRAISICVSRTVQTVVYWWHIQPKNYVQSDTEASLLWITSL